MPLTAQRPWNVACQSQTWWVFELDGILLVDMAAGRIYRVEFPGLRGIGGGLHSGRVQASQITP
jgi:hypothetical protein